ncbi:MAG: DUF1572 family protein [Ignavibacteriaceae bacterium]|jgi:uncharacterized damage-inducible protein DinB
MIQQSLSELFERDLTRLKEEITLYSDESKIWVVKGEIKNSAGNLALHLLGNLNHFIGAVLGNNGYVRNRDAEFSDKNVSLTEMINNVDKTKEVIKSILSKISDEELAEDYPVVVLAGKKMKTGYFLIHLAGHLNYHLGQINYHRRLI